MSYVPEEPQCSNCVFYGDASECRAHPPKLTSTGSSMFPQVSPVAWCGEWQRLDPGPAVTFLQQKSLVKQHGRRSSDDLPARR